MDDDLLEQLLHENQITKTLTLISKDSLYSYVFSISDQRDKKTYALKLIPIGRPATESEDSKIRKVGIHKNITSDSQLVKEEFDNLQKFYYSKTLSIFPKHICPEPIFGASYPDYNSVITLLKSACKEDSKTYTKTRAAVDEIENLFGILKSQGYQDIQLGCILMEYIPGQTLLEKKKKIKKKFYL